jgi:ankyrin repeat protein
MIQPRNLFVALCCLLLITACSSEHKTDLMKASKNGDLVAVKKILDLGAKINQQNNKGKTALMFAASEGHLDVARYLIEHGANVNIADHYGTTALVVAATTGKTDIVDLLLKHHANPDVHVQDGGGPLVNAIYFGHTKIVNLLLPKMTSLSKKEGEELLLLASGLGHADIVSSMIDHGISPNAHGRKHRTALMAAAAFNRPGVVKVLLANGADPTAKDDDGETAYSVARDKGNDKIVSLLGPVPK